MAKKIAVTAQISEMELASYLAIKEQYEKMKKETARLEKMVKGQASSFIDRIKAGEEVIGNIEAVIVQEEGSCRPAWKEEYLSHMHECHGISIDTAELQVQQRTEIAIKDVLKVAAKS